MYKGFELVLGTFVLYVKEIAQLIKKNHLCIGNEVRRAFVRMIGTALELQDFVRGHEVKISMLAATFQRWPPKRGFLCQITASFKCM